MSGQSVTAKSVLTIKSEIISGYLNTRGVSSVLNLSQNENEPEVHIGNNAGAYSSGTDNTFVGINSGYNNNGSLNVAVGYNSAYNNTGSYNTYMGTNSGLQATGSYNTCMGYNSGYYMNAEGAVLLGENSGLYNRGYGLVAIGSEAGQYNSGGDARNVFIGSKAGQSSTGSQNTFIGGQSGRYTTGGSSNVFIGANSSVNNQTGSNNICIGVNSNTDNVINNVLIGNSTVSSNSNNINIGHSSNITSVASLSIGSSSAISAPGGLILGNSSSVSNINGIVIGNNSAVTANNGIAIGNSLNANQSGLFVNPVRSSGSLTDRALIYNTSTSEISYSSSKTFIIDHPIDSGKYLVHACLEGPEAGVYYRGKGEVVEGEECKVLLPQYVRFAREFSVNVTPIGVPRSMSCSEVVKPESPEENVYFIVYGTGKFYWTLFGKREDIEAEIDKESISVNGSGPYRWIDQSDNIISASGGMTDIIPASEELTDVPEDTDN
jgi:hypothetical protein